LLLAARSNTANLRPNLRFPMRRALLILLIVGAAAGIYLGTRPPREDAKAMPVHVEVVAQTASLTKPAEPYKEDPLGYLESCLERCEKEVQGYICTFRKQERVQGRLLKAEKIVAHCREKPFSVHMDWLEGEGKAKKVLYVEGENDGKMLVRAKGPIAGLIVLTKDPEGPETKAAGRFPVTRFGMIHGLRSVVESMQAAKGRGTLHVRYEGKVKLAEAGDRELHQFVRTPYEPPEVDGIHHLTVFIDPVTGLQVGSIVKNAAGELIAEYFFSEIQLNPRFSAEQFTRKAI